MSTNKKSSSQSTQYGTSSAAQDPVATLQQVARALPATAPVTVARRNEMHSVERRAPAQLIALVLSAAEEGGGNVAGFPIDATASRNAVAQATRLRVGAAAARAIARVLEDEALGLASGVAQEALSATTSLEAFARTSKGRSQASKAAELRAAARVARRRSSRAKSAEPAPAADDASAQVAPEATASKAR